MNNPQKIKALNNEECKLKIELRTQQVAVDTTRNRLREINREREALKKEPSLSDHAFMRYLERYLDMDFELLKSQLLSNEIKQAINSGAKVIKYGDIKFAVKDKTITTII